MQKTLSNIHIYLVGDSFHIVPLLRQPNGTWVEVQPVLHSKKDVTELRDALQQIRSLDAGSLKTFKLWDGNGGAVWSNATQFWSVYWHDNGNITIVPQYHRPTITDPETGKILDGGWADNEEKKVILFNDISLLQTAKTIIDLAEST